MKRQSEQNELHNYVIGMEHALAEQDFIKVKSHLEDFGPSVIKQNRIAFHHMLANSLADVVAKQAARRLLPDLNLERKARWAERVGVGVAKRMALVGVAKLEISTNSTLCWWKRQHARGLLSARLLMSWPTKGIYWYVTTKVCDAKFAMCTEHTSNSNFGVVILVCHGQAPPRSSHFSKTRKKEVHQHGSRKLASRSRPLHFFGLPGHPVHTQSPSACLFLSLNSIPYTLSNVVTTPFLKLQSRVAKAIRF